VSDNFTAGEIKTAGETICYGATPGVIGSQTNAAGCDNSITYEWRHNGTTIDHTNAATYQPAASYSTVPGAHTFTRWAKDGACSTTPVQSTGQWVLTVNALPTVSGPTAAARCGAGTVTLSATASSSATIDWYSAAAGGNIVTGGTGTTSFTTPLINSSTTYYAQARNTNTSCVSAARTAVVATVNTVPDIAFVSPPAGLCTGSQATLTVNDKNNAGGSYCFTYECAACVHNPYLTGNDAPAAAACHWYSECVYGTANTFTVDAYDAGTLTVRAKAKTVFGCEDSTTDLTLPVAVACTYTGCTTPTLTLGTVGFTSSTTYSRNGLTISSPVTATYCNTRSYTNFNGGSSGAYKADCAANYYDAAYGNWFSWCLVKQYASKLCPRPWRVPTLEDHCLIVSGSTGDCGAKSSSDIRNGIGYRYTGYATTASCYNGDSYGCYWSSTVVDPNTPQKAYWLWFDKDNVEPTSKPGLERGAVVRCVQ
jgi:uncharacterized protein (TIGR02145 family)